MIVLCNPPPRQVRESHDRPDYPHLGLAYLAGALRNSGEHLAVLDGKFLGLSISDTVRHILDLRPRVLCLTAMTHEITVATEIASRVKQQYTEVFVVVGGVHVTARTKETLEEFPDFDMAVRGEGEEVLPKLISRLIAPPFALEDIPGIAFRREGKVEINEGTNRIMDLDTLPRPAFDLFPAATTYPVITGRGCPFRCNFCMRPYGQQVRYRSVSAVLDEIRGLIDTYGPEQLVFYDETFTLNHNRIGELLAGFREMRIPERLQWVATTHVNTLTSALAAEMKACGCRRLSLGAESGDKTILAATGKGSTMKTIRLAFTAAHKAGLVTEGFFIMGHPNETPRSLLKTICFAIELNPTIPVFGIMVPYPGTDIARIAAAGEGKYRIESMNWDDYNKQIGHALSLQGLPRKIIELFQVVGYISVFLCNGRFRDFVHFLYQFRREMRAYVRNMVKRR